jgi:hypothetical protein
MDDKEFDHRVGHLYRLYGLFSDQPVHPQEARFDYFREFIFHLIILTKILIRDEEEELRETRRKRSNTFWKKVPGSENAL